MSADHGAIAFASIYNIAQSWLLDNKDLKAIQGFPKVASRLRRPVIARSAVCDEAISDSEGHEIASPSQAQGRHDFDLFTAS